jgi:hypothetical protein
MRSRWTVGRVVSTGRFADATRAVALTPGDGTRAGEDQKPGGSTTRTGVSHDRPRPVHTKVMPQVRIAPDAGAKPWAGRFG